MVQRIGDYILRGELRNTRANGVFGWIEFAPDLGLHIELTGNLSGELRRKHIRFSTPRSKFAESAPNSELPKLIENLADRQIGVIGDVMLRRVRVPTIPLPEFSQLEREDQQRYSVEKDCLYLEWYSQNGRVEAEIIDPEIEFVDERSAESSEPPEFEPLGDGLNSSIAEAYLDHEGGAAGSVEFEMGSDDEEPDEDVEEDDPYGLFDPDLQREVAEALESEVDYSKTFPPDDNEEEDNAFDDSSTRKKRSWDEVIPGIDPQTKAMYEQWDEIFEGEKDEPVACLFETPLRLPPPDRVTSDDEAQSLVVSILAQLALLSVAVDVCEHFTPLQTYRLLMTEILPTAKVHPNLAASRMVQHYSTSDYCDACEAEFDEDYQSDDDNDDDDQADDGNAL